MEKELKDILKKTNGLGKVEPKHSKIMKAIRSKNNKNTEVRFRFNLVRRGIKGWKTQFGIYGTRPDFYFPNQKLAIFIDGCFWHGCPHCGHIPKTNSLFWEKKIELNKLRDLRNIEILSAYGLKVVRIWEHEIESDINLCLNKCGID
jgi:DNA mismatch endonuclease, patch repair protein